MKLEHTRHYIYVPDNDIDKGAYVLIF